MNFEKSFIPKPNKKIIKKTIASTLAGVTAATAVEAQPVEKTVPENKELKKQQLKVTAKEPELIVDGKRFTTEPLVKKKQTPEKILSNEAIAQKMEELIPPNDYVRDPLPFNELAERTAAIEALLEKTKTLEPVFQYLKGNQKRDRRFVPAIAKRILDEMEPKITEDELLKQTNTLLDLIAPYEAYHLYFSFCKDKAWSKKALRKVAQSTIEKTSDLSPYVSIITQRKSGNTTLAGFFFNKLNKEEKEIYASALEENFPTKKQFLLEKAQSQRKLSLEFKTLTSPKGIDDIKDLFSPKRAEIIYAFLEENASEDLIRLLDNQNMLPAFSNMVLTTIVNKITYKGKEVPEEIGFITNNHPRFFIRNASYLEEEEWFEEELYQAIEKHLDTLIWMEVDIMSLGNGKMLSRNFVKDIIPRLEKNILKLNEDKEIQARVSAFFREKHQEIESKILAEVAIAREKLSAALARMPEEKANYQLLEDPSLEHLSAVYEIVASKEFKGSQLLFGQFRNKEGTEGFVRELTENILRISRNLYSSNQEPTEENILKIIGNSDYNNQIAERIPLAMNRHIIIISASEEYVNIKEEVVQKLKAQSPASLSIYRPVKDFFKDVRSLKMALDQYTQLKDKPALLLFNGHGLKNPVNLLSYDSNSQIFLTPEDISSAYQEKWHSRKTAISLIERDIILSDACYFGNFLQEFLNSCQKNNLAKPFMAGESEYGQIGATEKNGGNNFWHIFDKKDATLKNIIDINLEHENSNPSLYMPTMEGNTYQVVENEKRKNYDSVV